MKKVFIFIGVALVAVLIATVIYLFVFEKPATAPDTEPVRQETNTTDDTSTQESEEPAAADSAVITYSDDGFSPDSITIEEGQTIIVKNGSSDTLDFASDDHPTHQTNSELNVGLIEPGEAKSFKPSKGSWGYHDHLNASATGSITVN